MSKSPAQLDLLDLARSLKSYVLEDMEKKGKGRFYLTGETRKKAGPQAQTGKRPAGKTSGEKTAGPRLEEIRAELDGCTRCVLSERRKKVVFGEGNPAARLMFVGEGPGEDEDNQGRPFVGRAGQLLNKIIAAMGMKREDVYIANVVKCRPPGNRAPRPEEVEACTPFLERQIEAIGPKVICALGSSAAHHLLKSDVPVSVLRGRFSDYEIGGRKLQVMVTYHPAYLLRNPAAKKQVWEDMQKILEVL